MVMNDAGMEERGRHGPKGDAFQMPAIRAESIQVGRLLPTSRLPITNHGTPASDHFRFADHSGVIEW
jgi:hypothetical protein